MRFQDKFSLRRYGGSNSKLLMCQDVKDVNRQGNLKEGRGDGTMYDVQIVRLQVCQEKLSDKEDLVHSDGVI